MVVPIMETYDDIYEEISNLQILMPLNLLNCRLLC